MVSNKFRNLISILFILCLFSCRQCNIYNIPSEISWGGRTMSLAVHPTNEQIIWAASESGGLFYTTNGGDIWRHVDSVPFATNDVEICPIDPNVIIATTRLDTRVSNSGAGIWVSRDAGRTWRQPRGSIPIVLAGTPPSQAYGICFQPRTGIVYVGTDNGICKSIDTGRTWNYINPELLGASPRPIYTVLALNSGKVLAYGNSGILISDNGSTDWRGGDRRAMFGWGIPNALAVSPLNGNHVFFTNGWNSLWYSLDGGGSFRNIQPDSGWYDGRQPYVKVARSLSGNANEIDLYYSNRAQVHRKTLKWSGRDYSFTEAWTILPFRHPDPADLVFSRDGRRPIYASNDGGIEESKDSGTSWKSITNPSKMYNALQAYTVKGSFNTDHPDRIDVYFGTQDNGFWSSSNKGSSWPHSFGEEGYNIQGPHRYNSRSDSAITLLNIGRDCSIFRFNPNFRDEACVPRPSDTLWQTLPVHVRGKRYVCFATLSDTSVIYMQISDDEGRTWTRTNLTLPKVPVNFISVTGTAGNETLIVPYFDFGSLRRGAPLPTYGLYKIENALNARIGDERVIPITLPINCNLGTYSSEFDWHPVYAVDPRDPNYIIIPDVVNNKIVISADGGRTAWTPKRELFNMVTEGGNLAFHRSFSWPQVRHITFNPNNSNQVLLGTYQAGVFYSNDRGRSWCKIRSSEKIFLANGFFFDSDTSAFVSTYGRGLWKIKLCVPGPSDEPILIPGDPGGTTVPGGFPGGPISRGGNNQNIPNTPSLYLQSVVPGNAIPVVYSGESTKLVGRSWVSANQGATTEIRIDKGQVVDYIKTDDNGNFEFNLPNITIPGLHEIDVVQRNNQKEVRDARLFFYVKVKDRMPEK